MSRTRVAGPTPGTRFGRWTVKEYIDSYRVDCVCDCGTTKSLAKASLEKGISRGCRGCSGAHASKTHKINWEERQQRLNKEIEKLVGKKFNFFTVIAFSHLNKFGQRVWKCQCQCGQIRYLGSYGFRHVQVSCGCERTRINRDKLFIHGLSKTSEHSVWRNMMARCYDPQNREFSNYGGRGIVVCQEWHDPVRFYADMGSRSSCKDATGSFPQQQRQL